MSWHEAHTSSTAGGYPVLASRPPRTRCQAPCAGMCCASAVYAAALCQPLLLKDVETAPARAAGESTLRCRASVSRRRCCQRRCRVEFFSFDAVNRLAKVPGRFRVGWSI